MLKFVAGLILIAISSYLLANVAENKLFYLPLGAGVFLILFPFRIESFILYIGYAVGIFLEVTVNSSRYATLITSAIGAAIAIIYYRITHGMDEFGRPKR